MPLQESEELQRRLSAWRSIAPRLWQRSRAALTGGVIAVVLAVATLWGFLTSLQLAAGLKAALLGLFLEAVVIAVLLGEIKALASKYEAAVAPLYRHHPSTDQGIDVISITPYTDLPRIGRESKTLRQVLIEIEPRKSKVLFFSCLGDIRSMVAYFRVTSSSPEESLHETMLTPNMFELDVSGRSGRLRLLFDGDDVRVAAIEWRYPHRS